MEPEDKKKRDQENLEESDEDLEESSQTRIVNDGVDPEDFRDNAKKEEKDQMKPEEDEAKGRDLKADESVLEEEEEITEESEDKADQQMEEKMKEDEKDEFHSNFKPKEDKDLEDSSDENQRDRKNESEETLEDLANESEDEVQGERREEEQHSLNNPTERSSEHIPHVNSLGSQLPSSGIYLNRQKESRGNIFHLIILVLIGVGVIGATVYLLKGNFSELNLGSNQATATPQPTEVVQATPIPSPTPETPAVKREDFEVRVLNGSGKSGLAATVSTKLKELGYSVERTGNATNSAFTKTVVRVKKDDKGIGDQLVKDLGSDYKATKEQSLREADPVDSEIILGAE